MNSTMLIVIISAVYALVVFGIGAVVILAIAKLLERKEDFESKRFSETIKKTGFDDKQ